ncbi:hypothetical protein BS329_32425 [Amycolatopsis coloradensis]|uniref:Uncharacterized protein n=1 Tax=Amycolatopsis coloradensis TaxID=76021 RepID=A0A1R0KIR5_9PSEU|nr:hypothetical protein [Amycolatopsis coloradensis]OLZ45739.1 hypothetical protein BS329_32425 [Amycolatopsis coloradensis]
MDALGKLGVDHPLVDNDSIADAVREILPGGVNTALELGRFTEMLSDVWSIPDFYPMAVIPNGVRLTAYDGESSDLPAEALQCYVDLVEAGGAGRPGFVTMDQ